MTARDFCFKSIGFVAEPKSFGLKVAALTLDALATGDVGWWWDASLGCSENRCFNKPTFLPLVQGAVGCCFLVNMTLTFLKPSFLSCFIWFHTWVSRNKFSLGRSILVLIMVFLLRPELLEPTVFNSSGLLIACSCSMCSTRQYSFVSSLALIFLNAFLNQLLYIYKLLWINHLNTCKRRFWTVLLGCVEETSTQQLSVK